MRRFGLFTNLKVRTSLVFVLIFFVAMLLVGAALGVFSLRANNLTLTNVTQNQQIRAALADSIDRFKSVQVALGRAVEAIQTKRLQDAEAKNDPTGSLSSVGTLAESATRHVERAKQDFAESQKSYEQYRKLSAGQTDRVFNGVNNAYSSLMNGGVEPLFDYLLAGDVDGYNAYKDSTGEYLQDDLYAAVGDFNKYQHKYVAQIQADEEAHYLLVIQLVAAGIIAALIISVVTHVFLGRTVLRPLRQAGMHFDRIASGDLTQRVDVRSRNEIGVLYEALRRMQESLTRTVTQVRQGVQEIDIGSREIFMGNTDLSSRTEQQAASLQQTAASMEELAGTVRQNTDNAQQADGLAKAASDVAQRGGVAVSQVMSTMDAISSSSSKIAEIVGVIDGIAFQTNILALNAAVEAARAGEQGKGFAVVAGEVRSLAQRSAQAAKEIKVLIEESLETIRSGARQADQAGSIMGEVVDSVRGVTTIMGEISSASNEQSEGIEQVNQAVAQMDTVVQQNAALVQEAAAAAGSLQEQATRLTEAVAVFKINAAEIIDTAAPQLQQDRHEENAYPAQLPASLQLAAQG